eukprot:CAMPEP_0172499132 /NCGR_PEP_ID=MMETSP1066-20121228/122627_1 /TAXON_ID=671091 /ORGANISM="Coscinodiscus wailesii, Strain CCMP2513" /LENGTH=396 /DNA_ID=CAMNT_0013272721 /DNA_START=172 /DNA_END=1362 /DNA_ORIENTATION=+
MSFLLPTTTQSLSSSATPKTPPANNNKQQQRQTPVPWIACCSATEIDRATRIYLRENDSVLELGSQLGDTSAGICRVVGPRGRATFVDVSRKDPKSGRTAGYYRKGSSRERFLEGGDLWREDGSVVFKELESLDRWRDVVCGEDSVLYDAMVVDLGTMIGNDLSLTTISLVQEFVSHQKRLCGTAEEGMYPRVVIIKSSSLASLSRRLIHGQRLMDGSATLSSTERRSDPYLIATVGVEDYRRTIPHVVKPGDAALEVGCHLGMTTKLIHAAAAPTGCCLGVDIGPKIVAQAVAQHPEVAFDVCDAWDTNRLWRKRQELSPTDYPGFDVVYADIGGLSGPDGLLESLALLDGLGRALEPRCVVIKSLCMRRLASSLRPFSEIWSKNPKLRSMASDV